MLERAITEPIKHHRGMKGIRKRNPDMYARLFSDYDKSEKTMWEK
jgi:hypothetical protein